MYFPLQKSQTDFHGFTFIFSAAAILLDGKVFQCVSYLPPTSSVFRKMLALCWNSTQQHVGGSLRDTDGFLKRPGCLCSNEDYFKYLQKLAVIASNYSCVAVQPKGHNIQYMVHIGGVHHKHVYFVHSCRIPGGKTNRREGMYLTESSEKL